MAEPKFFEEKSFTDGPNQILPMGMEFKEQVDRSERGGCPGGPDDLEGFTASPDGEGFSTGPDGVSPK